MTGLSLCITTSQEGNREEMIITTQQMIADGRDHTDTIVTMILRSSEDIRHVPKDPRGLRDQTEGRDQIDHPMIGTRKNIRVERRLLLLV